jgi:hypothetical protein
VTELTVGPGNRRRTLIIAGCVAVVIAAVVTVIVVVATAGGSTDSADSPAAVAKQWGKAALFRNQAQLRALSCPSARGGFGIYGIVFNGSGVRTGTVVAEGHDTWNVPVTTTGPLGGTTVQVKVERRGGKYLVC